MTERPLAVDLDGTLISSDLLVESASYFVVRNPLRAPQLLGWLSRGRSRLKSELAARTELDVDVLPYRVPVVDWLRDERASGRTLVLASASDVRFVQGVADHLGIFDEVVGSTVGTNLKASAKRDLLVSRYGVHGFDYVGNSPDDLPVWEAGRTAHVVGTSRLVGRAAAVAEVGRTFVPRRGGLRALVRAARPHQWAKNALLALPVLASQQFDEPKAIWRTLVAFVAFSLVASSVYLLNDLADVTNDRHHLTKRERPFASGELSLVVGWVAWPVLALLGYALALALLPVAFVLWLTVYLVATLAYTFWAKKKIILDVVGLGCLYTVRIVAGAAAIEVSLTMWLLTFSMLFFLSLALIKRVSELARIAQEDDRPELVRGRGYVPDDLPMLSSYGVASSIGAVVVFALYVNEQSALEIYRTPELLWVCIPVLLAWLMRAWLFAHRGWMDEDPIIFAAKDSRSLGTAAIVVAVFVAASVVSV